MEGHLFTIKTIDYRIAEAFTENMKNEWAIGINDISFDTISVNTFAGGHGSLDYQIVLRARD